MNIRNGDVESIIYTILTIIMIIYLFLMILKVITRSIQIKKIEKRTNRIISKMISSPLIGE